MATLVASCYPLALDTASANGTGGSAPTALTRSAQTTNIVVTADPSNTDVEFPSNAEEGDVIEIVATGQTVVVYPPTGDSFNGGFPSASVTGYTGRRFRKISTTVWCVF